MNTLSRKEKERLAREEDIVNAAEKIFTELGYNGASMETIAKAAQFARKTVYQYFTDKDDLFFTVIIRGFKRLLSYCQEGINNGNTGFEKLKNLGISYYKFYKDFPGTLQLMNFVGHIKSKNLATSKLKEFNTVSESMVQEVAKVIEEGKADGSIRSDLDTIKLAYSAEFLTTGFFNMISISGTTFTNHFSLNQDDFITFSINLFCDSFSKK